MSVLLYIGVCVWCVYVCAIIYGVCVYGYVHICVSGNLFHNALLLGGPPWSLPLESSRTDSS